MASLGRRQLAAHLRAATPSEAGLREKGPGFPRVALEYVGGGDGAGRTLEPLRTAHRTSEGYAWKQALRAGRWLVGLAKRMKSFAVGA
jgi:hypothetical protein